MGREIGEHDWQSLHQRVVMGETLSASEVEIYTSALQELDRQEILDGDLDRLRKLRHDILVAEDEQCRLRERGVELNHRIAALEAHLDPRTRELLGIRD